jgi:integrase
VVAGYLVICPFRDWAKNKLPRETTFSKLFGKLLGVQQRARCGDAPTKSGHIEPSTLKKQHARTLKVSGVRPFVLHALRHTFLTRLGERGCDVWTLARITGHNSIAISSQYVHPSGDAVLAVMERPGRQEFGHGTEIASPESVVEKLLIS